MSTETKPAQLYLDGGYFCVVGDNTKVAKTLCDEMGHDYTETISEEQAARIRLLVDRFNGTDDRTRALVEALGDLLARFDVPVRNSRAEQAVCDRARAALALAKS